MEIGIDSIQRSETLLTFHSTGRCFVKITKSENIPVYNNVYNHNVDKDITVWISNTRTKTKIFCSLIICICPPKSDFQFFESTVFVDHSRK